MSLHPLTPHDAHSALSKGARLVDIRDADEFAREHIPGAVNCPLPLLHTLPHCPGPTIYHCRTGMRTTGNADALAKAANGTPAMMLTGGIDAWRSAGLPTKVDAKQPLEIMRQVQITAGSLVLLGVILGWLVAPAFFALSAFVGAGLVFAGVSGWCGMANLLRIMPWNRRS